MLETNRVRTIQTIACALLAGVASFLLFAVVMVERGGDGLARRAGTPVVSYVAFAFLATVLPVWCFFPNHLARQQVKRIAEGTWNPSVPGGPWPINAEQAARAYATDVDKLLAVFQATTIVGLAQLEGVAFMGCIAYLVEARPFVMAVVATAVLLMLVTFPTRGRIGNWLARQQDRISELRQSQGLPGNN